MEIKTIKIEKIKKAEYNPRKISKIELNKLQESLEKFGCVRPLVINKRTGLLISGHQTLDAAKGLGWKELPYTEVDLDPSLEKILNVTLNKLSGDWDDEKLHSLLEEIKDNDSFNLSGFDVSDVDLMEQLNDDGSSLSNEPAEEVKSPVYNLTFEFEDEKDLVTVQRYFNNKQYGWKDLKKPNSNLLKKLVEEKKS